MELLDTIHDNLEAGGILVCSGIINRNAKAVTDKMTTRGYEILAVLIQEEWACVTGRYKGLS